MGKGKKVIPLPENELYSELIFSIARGNNYLQKIVKDLDLNASNTLKKLRYLEREKYLISHMEGNKTIFPFERKIYEINYLRILKDFIRYFIDKDLISYTQSFEFPEIHSKLKPLLTSIEEDMMNPEKNNQLKNQLIWFIQHFSKNKTKINGKEMTRSLLDPFFYLDWYITDLSQEDGRTKIIKLTEKFNETDKLNGLLELGYAIENLRKEFTKQYTIAQEEWIKKKYGKTIEKFDNYEKQYGTKKAWELTFKRKNRMITAKIS